MMIMLSILYSITTHFHSKIFKIKKVSILPRLKEKCVCVCVCVCVMGGGAGGFVDQCGPYI